MAQPEIVSFAETVAYLGLGTSLAPADAGLLQLLKGVVENAVRSYCGHDVAEPDEPYVHYLPDARAGVALDPLLRATQVGRDIPLDSHVLQLPQLFVRPEGLEVREDRGAAAGQSAGDFADETRLELGSDYFLDLDQPAMSQSALLIRLGAHWPTRPRTVRVVYRAGLTAAELDGPYSDVKLAVIDEIARHFSAARSRQSSGGAGGASIRSESIGGEYTVTYDTAGPELDSALSESTRQRLAPYVRLPL